MQNPTIAARAADGNFPSSQSAAARKSATYCERTSRCAYGRKIAASVLPSPEGAPKRAYRSGAIAANPAAAKRRTTSRIEASTPQTCIATTTDAILAAAAFGHAAYASTRASPTTRVGRSTTMLGWSSGMAPARAPASCASACAVDAKPAVAAAAMPTNERRLMSGEVACDGSTSKRCMKEPFDPAGEDDLHEADDFHFGVGDAACGERRFGKGRNRCPAARASSNARATSNKPPLLQRSAATPTYANSTKRWRSNRRSGTTSRTRSTDCSSALVTLLRRSSWHLPRTVRRQPTDTPTTCGRNIASANTSDLPTRRERRCVRTFSSLGERRSMPNADPDDDKGCYQDTSIETLQQRGLLYLNCHTATEEQARGIVKKGLAPSGTMAADVADDILTHLIQGAIVVPAMVAAIAVLASDVSLHLHFADAMMRALHLARLVLVSGIVALAACSNGASTSPAAFELRHRLGLMGAAIAYGRAIIVDTPHVMKGYVGVKMSCEACHLAAGTKPKAGSLVGNYARFPQWNKRAHRIITLEDRLAECFLYSMNGRPPAYNSPAMVALVAYIAWLSKGTPMGAPIKASDRFIDPLPARAPNVAHGADIYARKCIQYHRCRKPICRKIVGSVFRVYFTCRDVENKSSIGFADIDFENDFEVQNISNEPVLSPGELGIFDDSGVVMSYLMMVGGQKYLYYLAWNLKVTVPWLNTIGLAIWNKDKDIFEKYSRAPIMDRSDGRGYPFTISYPSILFENGIYRMWYGSNLKWGKKQEEMNHVIKYAESIDGIHWKRTSHVQLGLFHPNEYALSKPFVVKKEHMYQMWIHLEATAI